MSPLWGGVYERMLNGNLNLPPASPVGTVLCVGPCSLGTVGQVYYFGKSDDRAVRTELGTGDLADRVLDFLKLCGPKGRAIAVPAAGSTPGSVGGVAHTGTGTALVTSSGTPTASAAILAQILSGGAAQTATYRLSADGGQTWGEETSTPALGAPITINPTGAVLTFSDANPGGVGDVTLDGMGTATAVAGGTPTESRSIQVRIVLGGAAQTATFQYSLDGGTTWSETVTTPALGAAYAIPGTGCTITWSDDSPGAGSFVEDDVYDFEATATSFAEGDAYAFAATGPASSRTNLLAALDAAVAAHVPFEFAAVMTPSGPTDWTAFGGWSDDLFDAHKPVRMLCEAALPTEGQTGDQFVTARQGDMASFSHDRVAVTAGTATILDYTGTTAVRGLSGVVAGLIASSPVQRSIGSVMYCSATPPITAQGLELTEAQRKTLNDARYVVVRQHEGLTNWYVNDGNIACSNVSDYDAIEVCRVMDNIVRLARNAALTRVHSETALIDGMADEAGLRDLEGAVKNGLISARGTCSKIRFEIPEGQDVLTTRKITARLRVIPLGYFKEIDLEFALARS